MNRHANIELSHGAALHGHPLFEDQRGDVRRRAEQVARDKNEAVRRRFERRREEWLGRSSLFSFGELADVHVSRMPVDRDRDQGRRDFFELLRASIASGEFERAGRTRLCVIFESKSYRLTPELMRAGDGDAMQSLLRECWTLPEIGIEWCKRLKIELPSRWRNFEADEVVGDQPKQTKAASPGRPPGPNKTAYIDRFQERWAKGTASDNLSEEARRIASSMGEGHSVGSIRNDIRAAHQQRFPQTNRRRGKSAQKPAL